MTITRTIQVNDLSPEASPTEQQLEVLNQAHQALLDFGDFMTCTDLRGYVRASNRLLDACIDAGMAYDHPSHESWASERVTAWLFSACEAPAVPTTWAFKDGSRAARAGEPRDSNPCDPIREAGRSKQWFHGFDANAH